MHEYKAKLPTGEIVEFQSVYHLFKLVPEYADDDNFIVFFEDVKILMNLVLLDEIEINGMLMKIERNNCTLNN